MERGVLKQIKNQTTGEKLNEHEKAGRRRFLGLAAELVISVWGNFKL